MATVTDFVDLQIWQDARQLAKQVYAVTNGSAFAQDYRFCSQIRAAVGSIMDNIAEGFNRDGNKEFLQFLYIAKGSCGEVKSQLYRAHDVDYIDEDAFNKLMNSVNKMNMALFNFIQYLKAAEIKVQNTEPILNPKL